MEKEQVVVIAKKRLKQIYMLCPEACASYYHSGKFLYLHHKIHKSESL